MFAKNSIKTQNRVFNETATTEIYTVSLHYSFFFFNDTATTEIYTLSLHDALPNLALQMEHAARTGRGERRSKPLEFSLGGAKTAEERQAVTHPFAGDEPDQGVVDPTWSHANLHNQDRKSTRLNSSH